MTHLPTFLLVLEDEEEVKLYDFDWTVPPKNTERQPSYTLYLLHVQ